jgi:hypothetical protein
MLNLLMTSVSDVPASVAHARLVERVEEGRIGGRVIRHARWGRVGRRRHRQSDADGEAGSRENESHRPIIVHIGPVVLLSSVESDGGRDARAGV